MQPALRFADPFRPAFVWSPDYEVDIGRHVFPTRKFRLVKEALVEQALVDPREVLEPRHATDAELLAVLHPEYLRDLRSAVHTERTRRSELPMTRAIVESMIRTAGGTLLAAREALVRGGACHFGGGYHHGFPDHAEGFCYVNDVAVAAAVLLREGAVRRISVIDLDVHQGNGTAAAFRGEARVFTFSMHQEALYPRAKEHSTLDVGLEPHPGQEEYLARLAQALPLAVRDHDPDLVFYLAGVDVHATDVLGRLGLTTETIAQRDRMVLRAARERGIPFVTVVSGGYCARVEDTVALHAQTVAVALEEAARPATGLRSY